MKFWLSVLKYFVGISLLAVAVAGFIWLMTNYPVISVVMWILFFSLSLASFEV